MKEKIYDIAVLGGGAAGIMAAIQAAEKGAAVVLLETNEMVGKKILATGNGKCNLTNDDLDNSCYYGATWEFIQTAMEQFSVEDTLKFFHSIGISTIKKESMYYPRSQQASSVRTLLEEKIKQVGVTLLCEHRIRGVKQTKNGFCIAHTKGEVAAKKVIVTLGGKASSIKGSNGDGYYYAQKLGHQITTLAPALVQLHCDKKAIKHMAGARCDSTVSLFVDGAFVGQSAGELQLTEYGISGILVFQISRMATIALNDEKKVVASIDFVPEIEKEVLKQQIKDLFKGCLPEMLVKHCFIGFVRDKIVEGIFKENGLPLDLKRKDCSVEELECVIDGLKEFTVEITKHHGFEAAQVTAGGVDTKDISPKTMESKLVKGMYFAGEILDVDGICGGYNLQWAWTSGAIAGSHAAKEVL